MTTSQFVIRCRERAGLTQEEFAKELRVTRGTVAKWESGMMPRIDKIQAMLELIGLTFEICLTLPDEEDQRSRKEKERRLREMLDAALKNDPESLDVVVRFLEGIAGGPPPANKKPRPRR